VKGVTGNRSRCRRRERGVEERKVKKKNRVGEHRGHEKEEGVGRKREVRELMSKTMI